MQNNSILNKSKNKKNNDEWYTPYDLVEEEVCKYKKQFENKIVLCNCDDPFESSFSQFFLKNFNNFKLRKLICTSYKKSKINMIVGYENILNLDYGYAMVVEKFPDMELERANRDEISCYIKENANIIRLNGDGDFRSDECIEYLKEADIIVTNPPFSKFSDMFILLEQYGKKYLLISNQNALMYKEIFPYVKKNLVWTGYRFGDMSFKVPNDTSPRKTRFWIDETGQKWRSLGNATWITNLEVNKEEIKLDLSCKYDEKKYQKYDNFDAIHIKRVSEIPYDYDGIMGVPLTYMKYHNPNSSVYEIVGEANHGTDNEYDLFKPIINGKEVFKRILIRRKKND